MLRIRTVWFLGVTAALASGCVVESDGRRGNFAAGWDLAWVEDGDPVSCEEAGAAWVDLDMVYVRRDQEYHERFDCRAGNGVISQDLPAGEYSVVLRVRAADETLLSENRPAAFRIDRGTTYLTDSYGYWPVMELQSFVLYWSVSVRGARASCAHAGATWVELLAQPTGSPDALSYLFPCADGSGITQAIGTGSYAVQVRLLDGQERPLPDEDPRTLAPQTVVVGDRYRAVLEPVTFRVP
jgi:hypothetical protein